MVVGDNRGDSDSRTDQVVAHDGLESCLPGLEVTASKKPAFLLSILNNGWVEGVLWGAIQVKNLFFNASDAEKDRGSHRGVVVNSSLEVLNFVKLWKHEHLCVCGPKDNNFVNFLFHVLNILSDLINTFLISSFENVVYSI